MDYKEKYNKLVEAVKVLQETNPSDEGIQNWVNDNVPELKESEDEKIRKNLIGYIKGISKNEVCEETKDSWIAWLEKQGEQKPTLPKWKYKKDNTPLLRDSLILNKYGCVAKSPSSAIVSDVWVLDYDELAKLPKEEIEKQGEQKPNKVEPKFHEGEWVVSPNGVYWHIDAINNNRYEVSSPDRARADWPLNTNLYHLWTIKDAKAGDVLVDEDTNVIGIFEGIEGMCWHSKFYYSNFTKEFYGIECGGSHLKEFAKPATKEQRDTLERAITNAGYRWNKENLKLEKI